MTAARIPEPREWLLTKRCPRCGETKPWAQFPPRTYWPDGAVRTVEARCAACDALRLRSTPSRQSTAERREYKNAWARRKRAALRAGRHANVGSLLPVEPFRGWLLEQRERFGTWREFGAVIGVDESTLRRAAKDHRFVSLDVADRCLTRLGFHLDDLYPAGALVRHAARMGKT